jgi:hypothetical protein
VPAFIAMTHNGVSDREHWQEAIQQAGKPIVVMGGITSALALLLALILPKPPKKPSTKKLPEKKPEPLTVTPSTSKEKIISDQKISAEKKLPSKKSKKYKKKKKNPYLPDDFQPQ